MRFETSEKFSVSQKIQLAGKNFGRPNLVDPLATRHQRRAAL